MRTATKMLQADIRNAISRLGLASSIAALAIGTAVPAHAQQAQEETPVAADSTAGDIVVTARKRAEDILETPIAVSALTSADIESRGITSFNDIANNTPGLNISNVSSGRSDRSFQQIIVRGFTPSAATNPTVALFIDGVAVSSPTAFLAVSDPELSFALLQERRREIVPAELGDKTIPHHQVAGV